MEAQQIARRSGRKPRPGRTAGGISQRPWKQARYSYRPVEILSDDQIEAIHGTALRVLEEIGMKVLEPRARSLYRNAGFDVNDDELRVRFDHAGIEALIAKAPSSFNLHARNPDHNLVVGDGHVIYSAVGGPAFCMDLEKGRRTGTFAEMCDYLRLIQSLNVLQQEGGGPFEALDLPAETRHLDQYHAQIRYLDKNWQPWGLGREKALDGIEMGAMMLGVRREDLAKTPIFTCTINTNSPLQLDVPMAEGLMTMAEYGQAVILTPFTLSGAMSPVTLAGALAQQHAEAMAGIALTQIVRPGAPVLYGGFTSNVDMRSGAPAFGTPEYAQAAQASGQLARRLTLPFRSSNVTAANDVDAQAAYESQMSLWGAMMGQANLIMHAAGWLGGGLTASFEKLILDAEMLQMMSAYLVPFAVDEAALGFEAIKEVGPAGHFFGAQHTMERYETAFYKPLLSNWDNFDTWVERGKITAEKRANQIWKQLLSEYEQPPLDPAIDEALGDYVARRKAGEPVKD